MKRKPDILVILAALLGLGMLASSISATGGHEATPQVQVSTAD